MQAHKKQRTLRVVRRPAQAASHASQGYCPVVVCVVIEEAKLTADEKAICGSFNGMPTTVAVFPLQVVFISL